MEDISSRLVDIQNKIGIAAQRAGRDFSKIEIIAVSKTQPETAVREAMRAGLGSFGENKVQEARGKIESIGHGDWHLIGHLQSNKVRDAVQLFNFIDSVDRLELAGEINSRADAMGKTQNVLLQVNIAGESTKFGCAPESARALAEAINQLPRLTLCGLMTISPYSPDPEKSRPHFAGLRLLRDKIETDTGLHLPTLSMGMSGDYLVAVEEGATQIRLGTSLFGERLKLKQRRPEDPSFIEST
jgi:pyridoxal phosphate enzyme (YggS family)